MYQNMFYYTFLSIQSDS